MNSRNTTPVVLHNRSPERGSFVGITTRRISTSSTALSMIGSPIDAVIHDGGISPCVIEVVGVGGGGCNAIDRMLDTRVSGVDFWAINTDAQALGRSKAKGVKVLNVGTPATRGLGVGGNPDVRQLAADESRADIAAKTSCRQEEDEQASHNAVA